MAASRSRIVEIDHGYLTARIAPMGMDMAPDRLAMLPRQDSIRLELFDDVVLDFDPHSITEAYGGGYIWTGQTGDGSGGWVSLVIRDGRILGHVELPGDAPTNFRIEPEMTGGLHRITEQDGAGFPPEAHPLEEDAAGDDDQTHVHPPGHSPQHGNRRWNGDRPAALLDPQASTSLTEIDVLIPYTQAAANAVPDIISVANQAISLSNLGFQNSGVHIRYRLVGTHLVSGYSERAGSQGYTQMLRDLTDGVGAFQTVHSLRDQRGADLVGLLVQNSSVCGIGWVPTTPSAQTARLGYSLTTVSCVNNHTFAHETGHNMGLNHDRYVVSPTPPNSAYQYGHVDVQGRFLTIMSYTNSCRDAGVNCTRINNFSNPRVSHNGRPTGIAQNSSGAADAARWLNEVRHIIAAYRPRSTSGTEVTTTTSLSGPASSTQGQSVTFTATVRASSGSPSGTVSFRRGGTQFATATLNNQGVAQVSTGSLPVGTHQITARYLGSGSFRASTSSTLSVRIGGTTAPQPFVGGGAIFGQTDECENAYGTRALSAAISYSPSELFGRPSGLTLAWPQGSEQLSLWGPMSPSGSFLGAAGRQTWTRFVFYPNRPLIRVVQRQITLPAGGSNVTQAQELVLRLRVQNFGSIQGCAVTIVATVRRAG